MSQTSSQSNGVKAHAPLISAQTGSKNDAQPSNQTDQKDKNTKNGTNESSNNTKKPEMEDDNIEFAGKKPVDSDEAKKSNSSYYLYQSTKPEEAAKYKPKQIDPNQAKKIESKKTGVVSAWNTGATMEQFDYSDWLKNKITGYLKGIAFKTPEISSFKITDIEKMECEATILFVRGKLRAGYDISFEAKYNGKYINAKGKDIEINGSIIMSDICDSEDQDDWEFKIKPKKSNSSGNKVASLIKNESKLIYDVLNKAIKEFHEKTKK